jgi:hypothetical protein
VKREVILKGVHYVFSTDTVYEYLVSFPVVAVRLEVPCSHEDESFHLQRCFSLSTDVQMKASLHNKDLARLYPIYKRL